MAGIISELFIKFGMTSASLDRGLERVKSNVKQTAKEIRKETGQARDATELLGRTFGVQLPFQVRKFLASSSAIRPALAAAFNVAIIGGFAAAVIAIIPKIKEVAEIFGGLTQETKEWARELVKANDALLLTTKTGTMQLLSQVNDELEEINRRVQEGATAFGGQFDPGKPDSPREVELRRRQLMLAERLNELDRVGAQNRKVAAEAVGVLTNALERARLAWVRYADAVISAELAQAGLKGRRRPVTTLDDLTFGPGSAVFEAGLRAETLRNIMPSPEQFAQVMGFVDSVKTRMDGLGDSAVSVKQKFQETFQAIGQDLENSLVHFKSFGDVMVTVLQEIQRQLLRTFVISPFVKGLTALIGGFGGGKTINIGGFAFPPVPTPPIPRQFGGPAFAGQPLVVGEGGPEIFVPHTGGQIVPNGKLGGGSVTYNIDARGGSPGIEHRIREVLRAVHDAAVGNAVVRIRESSARSL